MVDTPPDVQADETAIAQLEATRYAAIKAADYNTFEALCHDQLSYAHSSGEVDTRDSYLDKCRSGHYVYHRVQHPISEIRVVGDVALVLGEMHAEITAGGVAKTLRNLSLAVWTRDEAGWRLLAYQPTPLAHL